MCFVGDTIQHKGDPKWRPGIFLTKRVTNDMFMGQCEGNLRLTRQLEVDKISESNFERLV